MIVPKVTAFGGGHGLYSSLSALRPLTRGLTAVVVVSDDGGSSGRLRDELHVPPPGDLRMALSALCEETEWGHLWRDVLQHRFSTEGPLDGHALGNLLIAGLWSRTGDVIEGLDWVARLLRAEGRVLPLASEALKISADVEFEDGIRTVVGQVAVATAPGRISRVWLDPVSPKVPEETLAAIREADVVVHGPGSWYSSVLPHFLVEPVAAELVPAGPRSVLSLNIAHEDDETIGMGRIDDVRALRRMAPGFIPAVVIVDEAHADEAGLLPLIEDWGARPIVRELRREGTVDRHDTEALTDAFRKAFSLILGG
ncbi:MAG: YvcK family protein [Demequinaceae bacterium]|nr:YvcK family protein [Demequinaceae bacterium]